MRNLRAFLVAVVLALVGVTFLSPAPGAAAHASLKTALVVTPGDPVAGETFTVSGRLPARAAAVRPVVLQRKAGHRWIPVVSGRTTSDGRFSLEASTAEASVQLRVVAKHARVHHRTYSRVVTATATVTTVAQSGTIQVSQANPGVRTLEAVFAVTPARLGRPVTLQVLLDDAWQDVATGVTNAAGTVTISAEPPPVEGEFFYRGVVSAWNGAPEFATDSDDVRVDPLPDAPQIETTSLPDGLVDGAYPVTLTATGGTEPYTWTATGLPVWLSLDTDGNFSGTPPEAGTWQLFVTVTGANGSADSQGFTLTVIPRVSITTTSLPDATVGERYDSGALTAVGGRQPYGWSSQGLPDGLNVEGRFGYIFGVPAQAGVFTVIITIDDATGTTVSKTFTLTVH